MRQALAAATVLLFAAPLAHARTLASASDLLIRARPASNVAPGAPGSMRRAIEEHARNRKWFRPVSEGTLPAPFPDGTCPNGMARVDDRFCIDRWEATLEMIEDGRTRMWSSFDAPDPAKEYRAVSTPGVLPQAYVSGVQAARACAASGKRLCRAVEWRHACGGRSATTYPYGPIHVESRCNDHGHSPMAVFYPQVRDSWALVSNRDMNDPRLNKMEGTLAKTGEHAGCVNDWGIYDMVGNLHEWVDDANGTFQGGYYLDTSENGEGCAYRTTAHGFDYHDYSIGFRCCADLVGSRDEDER